MNPPAPRATIGVFDSGVGGLSVLRALRRRLPLAALHYVADSAFAPYGERPAGEVLERSRRVTQHLLAHGSQLVVVACNTATALAIDALRGEWPALPFVGVEPGIKPAVARSRGGRIGIMATSHTVASERLRRLVAQHRGQAFVHLQACPGLALAIERGAEGSALQAALEPACAALREARVDTVVLGCTHYVFVADEIQRLLGPEVLLIDTATAIAERAANLWTRADDGPGTMRLQNTGDTRVMDALAHRWLAHDEPAQAIAL